MDRLTTDNPMTNVATMLNMAYAGEDHRVKLRIREDGADLCEYISEEARLEHGGCGVTADAVMEGCCMECDCSLGTLSAVATQAAELRARLKAIEDILGDTYDLDHLREMVEADKRPLKPGDAVYWLLDDDGWYVSDPAKVADVGTLGFYMGKLDGRMSDFPRFIPWDELGKDCFLSQEEAEAALAKMKEAEHGA